MVGSCDVPATTGADVPMTDDRTSLIDLEATAARLGVTTRHVRRLVAERRIPFIKWGHLLRFDPTEIDAWLDAHRHRPDEAG
jgi:excisionase family DNA binding protein